MKFVYIGKGMEVTDSLKARVEKKLTKLERYFQDDVEAQIRISQERGNRNIVEITISVGSVILRAEEVSNDMYMSIDRAVDKLNRQIRRHRTKLEKRLRAGAFEPVANEPAEPEEEVATYDLVRVKKFPVKPMHVDDAIAQMELLGHTFFLFLNEETDSMCVLYLRSDGSYGLLQPETSRLARSFERRGMRKRSLPFREAPSFVGSFTPLLRRSPSPPPPGRWPAPRPRRPGNLHRCQGRCGGPSPRRWGR